MNSTLTQQITRRFFSLMIAVFQKIRLSFFLFGVVALLTIASCKKTSYQPIAIDQSYFPLETGKYIIYDVDSTGYNNFFPVDSPQYTHTSVYQIKEQVDSMYVDNAGNEAFKIIRSKRTDASSPWIIIDIWSANLTDHTAEKVEENLRFIKLDFPILLNRQWYGNSYIQTDSNLAFLDGWKYEYTSVYKPLTLNGLTFDSTVTVTQDLDSNAIQQYIYIEKYAKHVGMIYKFEDSLSFQGNPTPVKDGHVVTMRIKEFN